MAHSMNFQKEKQEFLRKKDKSRKGDIDSKIKSLVEKINSIEDFFTTSSCSGRIMLMVLHKTGRKDRTKFLFVSHNKISRSEVVIRKLPKNDAWFKVQPAIIHVCCRNFDSSKIFLNIARDAGFRRSGIISIGKNRLTMELISTESIDTIIAKNGKLVIDENYFKVLVEEGNKKLQNTWTKITRLRKAIEKLTTS
jgi:tRNA wybutosine-synthesizing protein 3